MTAQYTPLDQLARRRAKAKIGWFIHAAIYVLVNLMLIARALSTGHDWSISLLLGWGIGLLAHGLSVWMLSPGGALLERMVERERVRLASSNDAKP
jgi:uncharacterized protein (DUF58 family)